MKNKNIINVLDAIGKALEDKDAQIAILSYQLDNVKSALANAEAKVQELQEELHGFYCNTPDEALPIRPEVTE